MSEQSFRVIVDTIPGLVAVMTDKGEVEHVNRQVLDYFGRTLEDLKQWGTTDAVEQRQPRKVPLASQADDGRLEDVVRRDARVPEQRLQ